MSQISIVTYTYNRELFLPRTIESVLSQPFSQTFKCVDFCGLGERGTCKSPLAGHGKNHKRQLNRTSCDDFYFGVF